MGRGDDGGYLTGPSSSGFRDAATLNPLISDAYLYWLYSDVALFGKNTRPDIYSYNLFGHSGKFFFNSKNNYKAEFVPYAPMYLNSSIATGAGFTMKDEHGDTYIIGQTYTETTSSTSTSGQHSEPITAWELERMISQNKRDTINFSYQSQALTTTERGQLVTVEDQQNIQLPIGGCPVSYISNFNGNASNVDNDSGINEQEISRISFKNGMVTFISFNFARESGSTVKGYGLDSMNVYIYDYSVKALKQQKSILFYKSYFNALAGVPGKMRLDSIQVLDAAGGTVQHYGFTYNNQPLPATLSFSRDYWGYYNGKWIT